MTRIAIAALAAVISTAASANVAGIRFAGDSAYVSYGDLNLQSQPGRTALTTRIQAAANRLCTDVGSEVEPLATRMQCYRVAVQSGVEQMDALTGAKPRG